MSLVGDVGPRSLGEAWRECVIAGTVVQRVVRVEGGAAGRRGGFGPPGRGGERGEGEGERGAGDGDGGADAEPFGGRGGGADAQRGTQTGEEASGPLPSSLLLLPLLERVDPADLLWHAALAARWGRPAGWQSGRWGPQGPRGRTASGGVKLTDALAVPR